MEVTLRQASLKDIETLLDIEKSVAHLKTYSAITTKEGLIEEFNKCSIFFIEVDSKIVGSISYEMKNPNEAYLSGFVVKPEFQGKGIGRKALILILEKLKGIKHLELVTHPDNKTSISLYTSLGFKIESRKENYYGDGESRIVLSLEK